MKKKNVEVIVDGRICRLPKYRGTHTSNLGYKTSMAIFLEMYHKLFQID